MTSHQSVTVSHKSKIFRSHLSQSDVWQCHRRDVTLTLAPPETRCHCGAQVEISPLPVVPTLSTDHQMAPLLPPLHPTHNWWDHHHQGRHRDTAAVRQFYPISTSSTLDSLLLVYELDIDQSWWNGSWAEKLSCSHTVMQSCSCSLLTLHCTRSRLLNKVSSDHYQGSMVLHWIFPPKELPSSICFHFENIYLMLARRWNFGWQECRPHTNVSLNFLTVNFQRTIYCLGLW